MKRLFTPYKTYSRHHWVTITAAALLFYGVGYQAATIPEPVITHWERSATRTTPAPVHTATPEPPGALSYVKPEPIPTPYNVALNKSFAAFLVKQRNKSATTKTPATSPHISESDDGGAATREFGQSDGTTWTVDVVAFPSAHAVKPAPRLTPSP
jgi:hypothetical protein